MWLHLISASTDYIGCFTEGPNLYLHTLCLSSLLWCQVNTKIMISYSLKLTKCLQFKQTISPVNTTNFSYHSHAFTVHKEDYQVPDKWKYFLLQLHNRRGIQLSNVNRFFYVGLSEYLLHSPTCMHVHVWMLGFILLL